MKISQLSIDLVFCQLGGWTAIKHWTEQTESSKRQQTTKKQKQKKNTHKNSDQYKKKLTLTECFNVDWPKTRWPTSQARDTGVLGMPLLALERTYGVHFGITTRTQLSIWYTYRTYDFLKQIIEWHHLTQLFTQTTTTYMCAFPSKKNEIYENTTVRYRLGFKVQS